MLYTVIIGNRQSKEPFLKETQNLISHTVKQALGLMGVPYDCEVSVTLTDDEEIHKINREHRGIDRPTDVLSFPQYEPNELDGFRIGDTVVLGDIVISLERARAQADEYGHSFTREVAFLCVHSVLHLLGYDHEKAEQEEQMCYLQKMILNSMGIVRDKK